MTEQEVVELMKSSQSETEWDANCEIVKSKCDGYPSFWYSSIVLSGVLTQTAAKWGSDGKIKIIVDNPISE